MGYCCLPPERVELTVNSKKETNGRVKMGQGQDGLLWLKSAVKTMESNWIKRSQLGPGSSWAWSTWTRGQIGRRSQYGSKHRHQNLTLIRLTWRMFSPPKNLFINPN